MFSLKQSGFAWLFAAIIVGIWEFLLHYSPNILNIEWSLNFLAAVPSQNFVIWHFLVIIWIPLYFIWYYHLYLMLRWAWEKISKIFLYISIFAFLCWGIWIASRGFIWQVVHMRQIMSPEVFTFIETQYLFYFENLLNVLRFFIFVISAMWIFLVLSGKTQYPKWMALCSPVVLLLSVFATAIVPAIWKYLIPIALNIAHFVLFSLSLFFVYKKS